MTASTTLRPAPVDALDPWVAAVRTAVAVAAGRPSDTARAVLDALVRLSGDAWVVGDALTGLRAAARRHPARVVAQHDEPDSPFSLQALLWPAGYVTTVHDHVAWGAVAVLVGAEHEQLFARDGDGVVARGRRVTEAGECVAFVPPNDVHRVSTPEATLALHVYGADLSRSGTSTRRRYDA